MNYLLALVIFAFALPGAAQPEPPEDFVPLTGEAAVEVEAEAELLRDDRLEVVTVLRMAVTLGDPTLRSDEDRLATWGRLIDFARMAAPKESILEDCGDKPLKQCRGKDFDRVGEIVMYYLDL